MKLRIARKMDIGSWKRRRFDGRDKRPWWTVYTQDQLTRAERRLRKSWHARRVRSLNEDGQWESTLTEDWFAANRVETRRVRQHAIRKCHR